MKREKKEGRKEGKEKKTTRKEEGIKKTKAVGEEKWEEKTEERGVFFLARGRKC